MSAPVTNVRNSYPSVSSSSSSSSRVSSSMLERIGRIQGLLKFHKITTDVLLEGLEIELLKIIAPDKKNELDRLAIPFQKKVLAAEIRPRNSNPTLTLPPPPLPTPQNRIPPPFSRTESSPALKPDPGLSSKTLANIERARQFTDDHAKNHKWVDMELLKMESRKAKSLPR